MKAGMIDLEYQTIEKRKVVEEKGAQERGYIMFFNALKMEIDKSFDV